MLGIQDKGYIRQIGTEVIILENSHKKQTTIIRCFHIQTGLQIILKPGCYSQATNQNW